MAVALPLPAESIVIAVIRALFVLAVGSDKPFLADALILLADAIVGAVGRAEGNRAVLAFETDVTLALPVFLADSVVGTGVGAGPNTAGLTSESRET